MSESQRPITYVNGQQAATVSIADRGLAYGDGIFETILVVDGEIPLWPYHHARLLKGLLYLNITIESQRLRQDIDNVLEEAKKLSQQLLVLKLIVTRGQSTRGYQVNPDTSATLIVQLLPISIDTDKHNGVSVHICQQKLFPVSWAGLKTLNQLPYVLASQERLNTEFDEGLLFSIDGYVVEATARNIFIVHDEKLYTPPLDQCGVEGVQRTYIIDKLVAQLGLEVIEKTLGLEDIVAADEVFLANSISGIWPVIQCENHRWSVGPVTRSLQAMCHGIFLDS